MMRCLDCGNTEVFREPQIEWQKVFYSPTGVIENTEHICYSSVDYFEDIECDKCYSTNISFGDEDEFIEDEDE